MIMDPDKIKIRKIYGAAPAGTFPIGHFKNEHVSHVPFVPHCFQCVSLVRLIIVYVQFENAVASDAEAKGYGLDAQFDQTTSIASVVGSGKNVEAANICTNERIGFIVALIFLANIRYSVAARNRNNP